MQESALLLAQAVNLAGALELPADVAAALEQYRRARRRWLDELAADTCADCGRPLAGDRPCYCRHDPDQEAPFATGDVDELVQATAGDPVTRCPYCDALRVPTAQAEPHAPTCARYRRPA